jgi:hypothetical protein
MGAAALHRKHRATAPTAACARYKCFKNVVIIIIVVVMVSGV